MTAGLLPFNLEIGRQCSAPPDQRTPGERSAICLARSFRPLEATFLRCDAMRFFSVSAIFAVAMAALLSVWQPVRGAQGDPAANDELLAARLASGEFASALGEAGKIADPQQRDQWLARIASAQSRSGARAASYNTLAGVQDDLVRAAAAQRAGPRREAGAAPISDRSWI